MKKILKKINDWLENMEKPDDWYGITVTVETKNDKFSYSMSQRIDLENEDYFLRFYVKQCIIEILDDIRLDRKIQNVLNGEDKSIY